jgi:hypothetical protein
LTNEPQLLRSRGDASVGIVVPPAQPDRLAALMTFTATGGQTVQIELRLSDVGRVAADLVQVLTANADQICRWWYRLSAGDKRPGTLATAENKSAVVRRMADG